MDTFLRSNKNASGLEQRQQRDAQKLILSRLKRPAHPREEVEPLVQRQPQQSLTSLTHDEESRASNNMQWNASSDPTINHRTHPTRQSEMQSTTTIQCEEEEDDIVCCDGGHCHEGTKNLCTIALWALIVFAITNRFFVHMARHLHKTDRELPRGDGGVVETDDIGRVVELPP
ncbi:hypothetical protein ACHAXT_005785 [Thalassiosira profunda]